MNLKIHNSSTTSDVESPNYVWPVQYLHSAIYGPFPAVECALMFNSDDDVTYFYEYCLSFLVSINIIGDKSTFCIIPPKFVFIFQYFICIKENF